jgi:ribosomal protein S13
MSYDIFKKRALYVTAFVGKNRSACVQVGLQGDARYEQLSEKEAQELAKVLMKEVMHEGR